MKYLITILTLILLPDFVFAQNTLTLPCSFPSSSEKFRCVDDGEGRKHCYCIGRDTCRRMEAKKICETRLRYGNQVCDCYRGTGAEERPKTEEKRRGGGKKRQGLLAPSNIEFTRISTTAVLFSWTDNSTEEFGVFVYRKEMKNRSEGEHDWKKVLTLQERMRENIVRTGRRHGGNYNLKSNTTYCYKLRAYKGFEKKRFSPFSKEKCFKTLER